MPVFDNLTPVPSTPKLLHQLVCECEALLFVSREPISLDEIARLTASPQKAVEKALKQIQRLFRHRGIQIKATATGWQFAPAARSKAVIAAYHETPCALSDEAMETLAVIAYLQPICVDGIAETRLQNPTHALDTLLSAGLIEVVANETGTELYVTSAHFLNCAKLFSLDDLPLAQY